MSLKRLFPLLFLVITLLVSYYLQLQISKPVDSQLWLINFSYIFNFCFTIISSLIIVLFYKVFEKQIGFIFLILSSSKILLFVLGFKILDFNLEKTDFLYFFIPFFICTFFEVFYISRKLNRSDFSENV